MERGAFVFLFSQAIDIVLVGRWPSFSVSQNADRAQLLNLLLETWRCGSIRPDRSDKTVKFEIRKIDDLLTVVIPHFEEYPLISDKSKDFSCFAEVCRLMKRKRHLELDGIREIVKLAMRMNPTGKRKYQEDEILNSLCSGEGIVCATWKCGVTASRECNLALLRLNDPDVTWSSDLHEWRNDFPIVSTTDSVKLKSEWRCSVTAARRKDPVDLYYSFALILDLTCVG